MAVSMSQQSRDELDENTLFGKHAQREVNLTNSKADFTSCPKELQFLP